MNLTKYIFSVFIILMFISREDSDETIAIDNQRKYYQNEPFGKRNKSVLLKNIHYTRCPGHHS